MKKEFILQYEHKCQQNILSNRNYIKYDTMYGSIYSSK